MTANVDYAGDAAGAAEFLSRNGENLGSASVVDVLRRMEEEAEQADEWDARPSFLIMTMEIIETQEEGDRIGITATTQVGELPLPTGGGAAIVELLAMGAEVIVGIAEKIPGHTLAFAICHEGWSVSAPETDAEAVALAVSMASEHRLEQHPDRKECRMLLAVDRYQNAISLTRNRGEDLEVVVAEGEHDDEGALVAVLRYLVSLIP